MGYFVVYFCIIIYLRVSTCIASSMLEGKMVSGCVFFFFNIYCYCSLISRQGIIPNELSKASMLSGFLFPTNQSKCGKLHISEKLFFFLLNLFLLILVDLKQTPPTLPGRSEGVRSLGKCISGNSSSLLLPNTRGKCSSK